MNLKDKIKIMERFTNKYKTTAGIDEFHRSVICLKEVFPHVFKPPHSEDLFAGKYIKLPIGVTVQIGYHTEHETEMVYYADINILEEMLASTKVKSEKITLHKLIEFWTEELSNIKNDRIQSTKSQFVSVDEIITNEFSLLLKKGIHGYKEYLLSINTDDLIDAKIDLINILMKSIDGLINLITDTNTIFNKDIIDSLQYIRRFPPKTIHQSYQLLFLHSVINNYTSSDLLISRTIESNLNEIDGVNEKVMNEYNQFVKAVDVI